MNDSQPPSDTAATIQPGEMELIRDWCEQIVTGTVPSDTSANSRYPSEPPFSFRCGDRSSRDWLRLNDAQRRSTQWQAGARTHTLAWRDAVSGIHCELELTEFAEYPALEWVVRLRNDNPTDTALITDFNALDTRWAAAAKGVLPELERGLGSDGRADDFQLVRDELRQSMWDTGRTIRMDSATNTAFRKARNGSPTWLMTDGRPSATWLPFFNLRTGSDGLLASIGWSGEWFAAFAHDGTGTTRITAGMEHLKTSLRPGESLRSPRCLILYWRGGPQHAHNLFRQFMLAWHSPKAADGTPLPTPICCGSWGGMPTAGHLELIAKIAEHRLPYDYYWVDAGWYGTATEPCPDVFTGKWWIVGDWRVNPNYHPHGLKPISDAAHRAGLKFLLWFEPERAKYGTPVTLEHPEWFLRKETGPPKENEDLLLNLGNPVAWQYCVETVSNLIAANGIDGYREDFNFDPAPYWRQADAADRVGIAEMRFVEGLYAFWDELRRRHPGLLIDNCASGGRRLELETLSRSLALWRTDYNCFPGINPDAAQLHTAGLSQWIPANSTSPAAAPGDSYQVRSAHSAGLVFSIGEFNLRDYKSGDYPWEWTRRMLEEAARLRPYFYGDIHPLTPCDLAPEGWNVLQLHQPGNNTGAILVFRRSQSPVTAASYRLQGLRAESDYVFTDADTSTVERITGRQLLETGLPLTLATARSSRLLFYSVPA